MASARRPWVRWAPGRGPGRVVQRGALLVTLVSLVFFLAAEGGAQADPVEPQEPAAGPPVDLDRPLACSGRDCERTKRSLAAMQRAAVWLARFPEASLQLDAAMMLSQARRNVDGRSLRQAARTAERVADRDHDHPHRRFYRPELRSPPEHTTAWTPPAAGERRANPNAVLSEALHCAENGFRPETTAYVCGPMRDGGGYHSTHALWGLLLARERGCVNLAATSDCLSELEREMAESQPRSLAPARSLDVDLYGERILMRLLAGAEAATLDEEIETLLSFQDEDGSFGVRVPGEPAYHRYHTTGIALWTLAEWHGRRAAATPEEGSPRAAPPTPETR